MDPNATLTHLRALAAQIIRDNDGRDNLTATESDADELAAAVQNLDQWIRNGGFLPADWDLNVTAEWFGDNK